MQKTIEQILTILILSGLCFTVGFFISCSSPPKRANFESRECYKFIYCLHENKKNDDKSICSPLGNSCTGIMQEQRYYDRIEFCEKNEITGMSANECRMYLNQK